MRFIVGVDGAEPVTLVILRDGERLTKTITPLHFEDDDSYVIGVTSQGVVGFFGSNPYNLKRAGFFDSFAAGYYKTLGYIKTTLASLQRLVTLKLNVSQMSGPIGVAGVIGDAITDVGNDTESSGHAGQIAQFIVWLCAIMSANVGVFNLLPLPALDGGRCVFLIIEGIRRKPIDPNKEGLVHLVGFALLMVLAVAVAFGDIFKLMG
jgi:regulator of sigma E protease